MRYLWTLIWTFLLVQMLVYVGGSMLGVGYSLDTGIVLTVAVTILIYIVPLILPDGPVEEH